ncbi:peroxisomal ATPase PEX1 [Prorops nasuta]|uniref:peroxisomal ATPase PEX1 n=1 Tax=Prorops nasuta TaxID=863751 RepID=UPI0034CE7E4D
MQKECLCVKYIQVRNCFVYLPERCLRKLGPNENCINILHGNHSLYFSCDARPANNEFLCLNAAFAQKLKIKEGEKVFVSSIKDAPTLKRINVTPASAEDREILELQREKIQSSLLDQLRIVAKHQKILIWISKHSFITLEIDSLEPNFNYGRLEQLTEVLVKEAVKSLNAKDEEKNTEEANDYTSKAYFRKLFSGFQRIPANENYSNSNSVSSVESKLENVRLNSSPVIFRVCPLPDSTIRQDFFNDGPSTRLMSSYDVLISKHHLNDEISTGFCKLYKVTRDRQVDDADNDDDPTTRLTTELIVRAKTLEDYSHSVSSSKKSFFLSNCVHRSIYVSEAIKKTLGLKNGSKIILQSIVDSFKDNVEKALALQVFPWRDTVNLQSFKKFLEKLTKVEEQVLLNNNAAFEVFNDSGECLLIYLKIWPSDCTHVLLDGALLEHLQLKEEDLASGKSIGLNPASLDVTDLEDTYGRTFKLRNEEYILEKCMDSLKLSLGFSEWRKINYDRENILICAEAGSGKSVVCKLIKKHMQDAPYFVHTSWIDCKRLQGKKAEVIQKLLTSTISECVYYQPSIIFFDDLECITGIPGDSSEENSPDVINVTRISRLIASTVKEYQCLHYISVIATCSSIMKIGKRLKPGRGCHFFTDVLTMSTLEREDRVAILKDLVGNFGRMSETLATRTEGWTIQDMLDFANKLRFVALKKGCRNEELKDNEISDVLEEMTPLALRGLKLFKATKYTWSDIGGLADVKRTLVEILHWPLKYPRIFKNAPIKLQNGVLLYGMPGTGKTILAKAIANECGVHLINIKGPELLSKYIGVSEESVRKVFQRARNAKPCVLFFDEFDSLAPRRGHDNTGVTDRVVNQLLTQLDGVEDREGIAVVAATSRPDLLDPALLRPGRLDKHLRCTMPSEAEREEILVALLKGQNVDIRKLNLTIIAKATGGYTGADLNAVLTQAKLFAFEEALSDAKDGEMEVNNLKITQEILEESVRQTSPSLSSTEIEKYERIYSKFSKTDNFLEDAKQEQKSTLA